MRSHGWDREDHRARTGKRQPVPQPCVLCGKLVSPKDPSGVEESDMQRFWHRSCYERHLEEGEEL
jgi:hypothetical protein